MKRLGWKTTLTIVLILISILFYVINYIIYQDTYFMFRLLTLQMGYLPISVILLTLILNQLLANRQRQERLAKLNMIIGAFFSEMGTSLMKYFADFDPCRDEIAREMVIKSDWTERDFSNATSYVQNYECQIDVQKSSLEELKRFLTVKRDFLLKMVENPNLLEHETFTDLLLAMFHLSEELDYREDLSQLPDTDYEHIAGDMRRAYRLLIAEWLTYFSYLKRDYPYLFSLAIRTNPLDPSASVVVR